VQFKTLYGKVRIVTLVSDMCWLLKFYGCYRMFFSIVFYLCRALFHNLETWNGKTWIFLVVAFSELDQKMWSASLITAVTKSKDS
jgi:hypothetical protein